MGRARMSDARPECGLCVLDLEGSVATLTLTRSEVFNAMNAQLICETVEVHEWTRAGSVGDTQVLKDEDLPRRHISELTRPLYSSYADCCLKQKHH